LVVVVQESGGGEEIRIRDRGWSKIRISRSTLEGEGVNDKEKNYGRMVKWATGAKGKWRKPGVMRNRNTSCQRTNIASGGISNEIQRIQLFRGKLNCCVSSLNSYLQIMLHLSVSPFLIILFETKVQVDLRLKRK